MRNERENRKIDSFFDFRALRLSVSPFLFLSPSPLRPFSKLLASILCLALFSNLSFAFETDQFNLPPAPLADIGDEVSAYVESNLRKAVDKINAEIIERQNCLDNRREAEKTTNCASASEENQKLAELRSKEIVARKVYNLLGTGIPPFTSSGSWMESHRFAHDPARYKTSYSDSIYTASPLNYLTISATVNLYGTQFGTDKIAHLFQQGYTYYKSYNRALKEGKTSSEAARKAVNWGRKTERTIYGYWVSRTFSNADLAANYAGLKFYQGLTEEISIDGKPRPAVLILKNGIWEFNKDANLPEILLKPFISNHLNEAYNPSIYLDFLGLRAAVRRSVKNHSCAQWRKTYPQLSKTDLEETFQKLRFWYGEDYGHKDSKEFVTIQNTCFD